MEKLRIEDFEKYHFLSDVHLSPDGKHAVFVEQKTDMEKNLYTSYLWLCDTEAKTVSPLTTSGKDRSAYWLDNETILFVSSRSGEKPHVGEAKTEYYTISIHGGEAQKAFSVPVAVEKIEALGGGRYLLSSIYNNMLPELTGLEGEAKEKALKQIEEEQDYWVFDELPFWGNGIGYVNKHRVRLYLFDAETGALDPITEKLYHIDSWNLNDAKDQIVWLGQSFTDRATQKPELVLYDMVKKERHVLIEQEKYRLGGAWFMGDEILFSGSDGKQYGMNENKSYYRIDRDGTIHPFYEGDLSATSTVGSDCRLGGGLNAKAVPGAFYLLITDRYSSRIVKLTDGNKIEYLTEQTGSVDCFDVAGDHCLFVGMRGTGLQELYHLDLTSKSEEVVSAFNRDVLKDYYVAQPEALTILRPDGVDIDGWVLLPKDYKAGYKYPAILDIHGGPKTAYGDVFYHEMQYWANEGYFVMFCNPRGGSGRGNEFADLRGKYGTIDYDDIMAFVDHVLEKYEDIDPARVGITGGSYGGFMTNWVIGHTDRFAAAASQRSICNWINMELTSDIGPNFAADQMAASTFTNPEKMWFHSPLKYIQNCKTPTLFIHSDEDYRCWQIEGIQIFSALKLLGVETRLCMFHGENHELSRSGKPKHRVRRIAEITAWFDRYLKN